MSENKVNVAVVGCGLFGEVHASTYANLEDANLVAVCDRNAERAETFAERFGCRACTSVAEIAGDESIEAVSVVTPDCEHRGPCVELARAGKHLLIEKPLATTVEDAEAIALAVDQAGVSAMVDFHNRYHPALLATKTRLDSGEMGRPQVLYARLSDRIEVATEWLSWAGRSGPEWFLGPHLVDLACWLFGKTPLRVFADARKRCSPNAASTATTPCRSTCRSMMEWPRSKARGSCRTPGRPSRTSTSACKPPTPAPT